VFFSSLRVVCHPFIFLTNQALRGHSVPRDWAALSTGLRKSTMSSDAAFHMLFHSLAHAVARGQSIAAWAWSKDVFAETALEWSARPEFAELVKTYRREAAEKAVSETAPGAAKATKKQGSDAGNVDAGEALNEGRIALAIQVEQARKVEALEQRVKALEESRALNVLAILRNSQN
jgi:hypothetical protein